jgi:hypothetical protein
MDRPSTNILCRVVPGIGFKVIRVFSASATNSGFFSGFSLLLGCLSFYRHLLSTFYSLSPMVYSNPDES